jgi:hypothetical protein
MDLQDCDSMNHGHWIRPNYKLTDPVRYVGGHTMIMATMELWELILGRTVLTTRPRGNPVHYRRNAGGSEFS